MIDFFALLMVTVFGLLWYCSQAISDLIYAWADIIRAKAEEIRKRSRVSDE